MTFKPGKFTVKAWQAQAAFRAIIVFFGLRRAGGGNQDSELGEWGEEESRNASRATGEKGIPRDKKDFTLKINREIINNLRQATCKVYYLRNKYAKG
jgi:hypothetical protein